MSIISGPIDGQRMKYCFVPCPKEVCDCGIYEVFEDPIKIEYPAPGEVNPTLKIEYPAPVEHKDPYDDAMKVVEVIPTK